MRSAASPLGFGPELLSFPFAPGGAGSQASLPFALRAPGPDRGLHEPPALRPLPNLQPVPRAPPSASRAEFPAPTKTSRRQERRGGPGPPSPHPKQVGKRGQVTTQGAPGASGPEHPRSSARGTAPLGRAGRLLAPTPPCRVLKGAGGPAGLCPFGWEGHARDSGQPHGPLEALASLPFLHSVLQNLL